MARALELVAAIAALIAAGLWFASVAARLPRITTLWDIRTYWDSAPPDSLAIKRSARMSAIAAALSGLCAALIGVRLIFFAVVAAAFLVVTEAPGVGAEKRQHAVECGRAPDTVVKKHGLWKPGKPNGFWKQQRDCTRTQ
jgi:hypothetical protein